MEREFELLLAGGKHATDERQQLLGLVNKEIRTIEYDLASGKFARWAPDDTLVLARRALVQELIAMRSKLI